MEKEELQNRMKKALEEVTFIVSEIQNLGLQNEQFALDFVDNLNELSVRF